MREIKSRKNRHFVNRICRQPTEDRPSTNGWTPSRDSLQAELEGMFGRVGGIVLLARRAAPSTWPASRLTAALSQSSSRRSWRWTIETNACSHAILTE